MPNAYVLLTAMPPTKGHMSLIRYARFLGDFVNVIVCTQPGEPMVAERVASIRTAVGKEFFFSGYVHSLHETVPQEPDNENEAFFWEFWANKLFSFGFEEGDYIVSSESYGIDLAEAAGGVFMPFDMDRWITPTKATNIRETEFIEKYQKSILPEFLPFLRRTVTIFGAESVGKTTVTARAGRLLGATITPEWARPYLEAVGPEITVERMHRIHKGQRTIQELVRTHSPTVYNIQDTDLFSTVGYWEMWDKDSLPQELLEDARLMKSDLYVVLSSDIPFEPDPLRYGGTVRESTDQYWIDLCEREGLPYVYITETEDRAGAVVNAIDVFFGVNPLSYQRSGKEYERGPYR